MRGTGNIKLHINLKKYQFKNEFNSKSLRNRVITISSNEKVSKYALKTFTYFSNVFLKCLNLDSFNLKFSSFITYVTSNIKSIFSAFLNRFSNFNFDINKIRLYKSDSVK